MKAISEEKLSKWGLLKQVYKEEIIDKNILKIESPDQSEIKNIFDNWLKNNGITSNDALNHWQKNRGLSQEDLKNIVIRIGNGKYGVEKNLKKIYQVIILRKSPY